VLEILGISKTWTTPLHPQSDGMVERYVKMVEEHLRKVISVHHRQWNERLPILLLAYRASTHKITGTIPTSMVFKRVLQPPCNLLFLAPLMSSLQPTMYHIHHYVHQNLQVASDGQL
jgi:hypothetical protein